MRGKLVKYAIIGVVFVILAYLLLTVAMPALSKDHPRSSRNVPLEYRKLFADRYRDKIKEEHSSIFKDNYTTSYVSFEDCWIFIREINGEMGSLQRLITTSSDLNDAPDGYFGVSMGDQYIHTRMKKEPPVKKITIEHDPEVLLRIADDSTYYTVFIADEAHITFNREEKCSIYMRPTGAFPPKKSNYNLLFLKRSGKEYILSLRGNSEHRQDLLYRLVTGKGLD